MLARRVEHLILASGAVAPAGGAAFHRLEGTARRRRALRTISRRRRRWPARWPSPLRDLVDLEAQRILDAGSEHALEVQRANRGRLDALVEALVHDETLDAEDAYDAAGVRRPGDATAAVSAPHVQLDPAGIGGSP